MSFDILSSYLEILPKKKVVVDPRNAQMLTDTGWGTRGYLRLKDCEKNK